MKTMQDYTNICTEEQTHRAYALGAPIEISDRLCEWTQHSTMIMEHNDPIFVRIPTTQQMIGWLREKGVWMTIHGLRADYVAYVVKCNSDYTGINAREPIQAELAAIDAALDYLEKQSKQ